MTLLILVNIIWVVDLEEGEYRTLFNNPGVSTLTQRAKRLRLIRYFLHSIPYLSKFIFKIEPCYEVGRAGVNSLHL